MPILAEAFGLVFQPYVLAVIFASACFGMFVGAIPGLSATMATALLVPVTFFMDPVPAIAAIVTATAMAIFAGDIPGALLRMPGTPASAAYVEDAYRMTRSGRSEEALGASLVFSSIGGIFGTIVLVTASPVLADIALRFSSFEYFWLVILGLSCAIFVSPGSVPRGMISLVIGLFAALVGIDNPAGQPRYTFGNVELLAGVQFIPAMIGLFAVSEVFRSVVTRKETPRVKRAGGRGIFASQWQNLKRYPVQAARGSIVGTAIGALPGAGADIAAWISYAISKRFSKQKEKFGTGHVEGLVEAGASNNGAVSGAWIPALVFGIPGDSITAIVIGVLYIKGINPGPTVFINQPQLIYAVFMVFFLANIVMLPLGWLAIKGGGDHPVDPAEDPHADHPDVLHRRVVRHQQLALRRRSDADLRRRRLPDGRERHSDRAGDSRPRARADAGAELHHLHDKGRRQFPRLLRATDRGRARLLHHRRMVPAAGAHGFEARTQRRFGRIAMKALQH